MSVRADVSGLGAQQLIELFIFDDTNIGGSNVLRWHPGTTITDTAVTWQGEEYLPFPIEAADFEMTSAGQLPRPRLTGANIGGTLGAYLRSIQDGLGAKVTRKRTLGKYLDAVNFPDGNPTADPNAAFPDETFYVARKVRENPIFIEMELAVAYDAAGVKLPRRQVIAGTCQWAYRSAECGYAGGAVQDIDGNPTSDPTKDRCRKTLTACKARFGETGILPTSAFPSSLLARYS